jgi:hypothetical protein
MKKLSRILSLPVIGALCAVLCIGAADAYQVLSSKELGKGDAKNQNMVVKCTTDTGKISTTTCALRRYAKCTGDDANKKCNGWQPWKDLRDPNSSYSDWRNGASECCRAKGLR